MALKRTATFHEFLDEAGRRFLVRLNTGMQIGTVETGLASERIEWQRDWGRYAPLSEMTAERLVEEFCRRQEQRQPIERINAELMHPGRQPRAAEPCMCGDRQLPLGDRS
jgi:hypothetical protein